MSTLDLLTTNPKHVLTVNDRSAIAGLKEGSEIPGYKGYIPQYKFHSGYTYGNGTHEMHTLRKEDDACHPSIPQNSQKLLGRPTMQRSNTLPEANGVRKLTSDMKPGYTGYVPRRAFIFGGTYRNECDDCVGEFVEARDKTTSNINKLNTTVSSTKPLKPIAKSSDVTRKLNLLQDSRTQSSAFIEDRRTGTEPPMPGYMGYVPRTGVCDLGLGGRYHQVSEKGYKDFYNSSAQHVANLSMPLHISDASPSELTASLIDLNDHSRRLYQRAGMIPKYTGYLPHEPFAFGKTYGNMTRSLSVCGHEYPTYGNYKAMTIK